MSDAPKVSGAPLPVILLSCPLHAGRTEEPLLYAFWMVRPSGKRDPVSEPCIANTDKCARPC
eukprot:1684397-Prymnesium_polylepis.1